ncbi:hypothetical protein [Marinobacterium sp. BA1]|uniref:hypothetical protein n=1 Tax=Marinobacterium sp. BA1 TaxID=3138931 RepID=UPI0032E620EA
MKRYEWTEEAIALLGTMPDRKLAEKLGVSLAVVRGRRIKEGIARSGSKKRHKWTKEELALLGTDTDQRIADRLGLDRIQVMNKRIYEEIQAFTPRPEPKDTALKYKDLLGTDTDKKIGKKIGCSTARVTQLRKELGIAAYSKSSEVVWGNSDDALLGTMSDRKVAGVLGLSASRVMQRRHKLGIDPYRKSPTPHKPRQSKLAEFPVWERVIDIDQPQFFEVISEAYMARFGKRLTYGELSKLTYWSVSRLQKWFTSGTAQQPLQLQVRHHIYLAIKLFVSGLNGPQSA